MDSLHPWIDTDEVRRLAARLMKPSHNPEVAMTDAGFDEGFVGFDVDSPASKTTEAVADFQEHSPITIAPVPVMVPVPEMTAATPREPYDERFHAFHNWMSAQFSVSEIFILDSQGEVIFNSGVHDRLCSLVRGLASAPHKPTANVRLKITATRTLEIIPVEITSGRILLGALVPKALSVVAVQSVMTELAKTANA